MILHISMETNYIDSTRQCVGVRKSKSSLNTEIIQKSGRSKFGPNFAIFLLYLENYEDFKTSRNFSMHAKKIFWV